MKFSEFDKQAKKPRNKRDDSKEAAPDDASPLIPPPLKAALSDPAKTSEAPPNPAESAPPKLAPLSVRPSAPLPAARLPTGLPPKPLTPGRTSRKPPAPFQIAAGSLHLQRQAAHVAYGQGVSLMKLLLKNLGERTVNTQDQLNMVTLQFLELLKADNQALIALTGHSTASNYLYAHSVNVAILSMHVGLGMGWDGEQIHMLGLAALLHDLGMMKYLGISQERRALTPEEHQEVRLHPLESKRLLQYIHDIEETTKLTISEIIMMEGQRRNKRPGRPADIEPIELASQIIGLCDMYEAMSHYRSWREPMLPSDAIKTIIKRHRQDFSTALLQIFIERLSLFPPGSFVELSGGEVACVIEMHAKLPTRPTVEILVKADRTAQEPPIIVNLAENLLVHIDSAVDETQLNLEDKRLLMAFQANRWWVD